MELTCEGCRVKLEAHVQAVAGYGKGGHQGLHVRNAVCYRAASRTAWLRWLRSRIHPARDGDQHEPEGIRDSGHLVSPRIVTSLRPAATNRRGFKQIQFPDHTTNASEPNLLHNDCRVRNC